MRIVNILFGRRFDFYLWAVLWKRTWDEVELTRNFAG